MKLTLQEVPAVRGVQWMRESFALFARKPLALSVMLMFYLLLALTLMLLPFIGPFLLLASLPLLTLGYMAATRAALANEPVSPLLLIEPFRPERAATRKPLLLLCALYALLAALLMFAADAADGGRFLELQRLMAEERTEANQAKMQALMAEPGLAAGLWIRFGGTALLAIPFWFAPALVSWHGQGVAQAMFSSTWALWRNKGAHLACALGFLAVVMVFSAVTGLLFSALGLPAVAVASALPAGLILATVFYISVYFGWRDTFSEVPSSRA